MYNLPEVLSSDVIYFTEGEKDADTLKDLGFAGTTTPGGGRGLKGYFKKNPALFDPIKGKEIRIISDNDEVGSEYIKQVVENIQGIVKNIKIFDLCKVMPNLKKKGDITDVRNAVGKERTLSFLKELEEKTEVLGQKTEEVVEEEELKLETREDIFNVKTLEKLYSYELNGEIDEFLKLQNEINKVCQKKKFTGFKATYKMYKDSQQEQYVYESNALTFPGLNDQTYNTSKYEMSPDGIIYEIVPNVGKILCVITQ